MSTEKKYNCEIIQDLLPLYQDHACSPSSQAVVEEHLTECTDCRTIAERLGNTDIDEKLISEKNHVLESHLKKERRKTYTIGLCFAGIFTIPILVCLICNLAIGHALDWFFIVLASLLVAASLIVVPLVVPKEHIGTATLGSFTVSLMLLFMVICIYTGGNWFLLASVPTFFGLSVAFMPYVIAKITLPKVLARHKGLLVMIWDTLWLFAVIIVCGLYANSSLYWSVAMTITSFCSLLPWALFILIRYCRFVPMVKAGISFILCGAFFAVVNDVVRLSLKDWSKSSLLDADFLHWSLSSLDANIRLAVLILSVAAGLFLIGAGIHRQREKAAG